MDTGTAVLFKTRIGKEQYSGTIERVVDYKSKWGDKLYHVMLDDGTLRIAFPDELTVADEVAEARQRLADRLGHDEETLKQFDKEGVTYPIGGLG